MFHDIKGFQPVSVEASRCPDFCTAVQICSELEIGKCDLIFDTTPISRKIYSYTIKLKNCSDRDIYVQKMDLSLTTKIVHSNASTPENTNIAFGLPALTMIPAVVPQLRILLLSVLCNGDTNAANLGYNAGFTMSPSTNLLATGVSIPPGECCIKLVFAVDSQTSFNYSVTLEAPVLCVSGSQMSGVYDCCNFERSLILPGECNLRFDRNIV